MLKNLLRYPGGKSKVLKHIVQYIPSFKEYREPFLGGGSVFIYLKQKYPDRDYWINDINCNLYLFWKKTQNSCNEIVSKIQFWKDNYKDGKKLHGYLKENINRFDELERGAAYFVLNRISFSGSADAGGFSKSSFEKRFTQSSIDKIGILHQLLTNTKITNLDYQSVLEEDGEEVFIFLDPPYFSTTKTWLYGENGSLHKTFDHNRLAEVLKNTKHKWLLTYSDHEYIRKLYSFANIQEHSFFYGMKSISKKNTRKGNEIFITNF